jgi:prevent-host-death family protein
MPGTMAIAGWTALSQEDEDLDRPNVTDVEFSAVSGEDTLREGLQRVLPAALVEATPEAREAIAELPKAAPDVAAASLAAALGSTAASSVASVLVAWLRRSAIASTSSTRLPNWLKLAALTEDVAPELVTVTDFSQNRSRYVRRATAEGVPTVISVHGTAVAALVPLVPGAYEEAVYRSGLEQLDAQAEERRTQLLLDWQQTSSGDADATQWSSTEPTESAAPRSAAKRSSSPKMVPKSAKRSAKTKRRPGRSSRSKSAGADESATPAGRLVDA